MLILQKVKIEGMLSFHAFFHFQEIFSLLQSEDAYLFYDFARDCLVNTSSRTNIVPRAKILLFGANGLDGNPMEGYGALRLLRDPALCLEETIPMTLDCTPAVFVRSQASSDAGPLVVLQDYAAFSVFMLSLFQDSYAKLKLKDPSWERMRQAVQHTLDVLTQKGKRRFSPEAASELYLYFLLHALAGVSPDNRESLSVLQADLDKSCPVSELAQCYESSFSLSCNADGSCVCPLAYETGSPDDGPLSIVELKNPQSHSVCLTVKDTLLTRTIPGGASVYALRKNGRLVCFLPRFRLDGRIATYLWQGKLYHECAGIREQVDMTLSRPVSWAASSEFGTFLVDQSGKPDETAAWPEVWPEKAIVMVDACALDYAMLLADGTVESRIRKQGWEGLLSISLGLNSGAAIDRTRQVLLPDGTRIRGIAAVEAKTCGEHYICMDANGRIKTDTGLALQEAACGVSVGQAGFAVACREKLCLYDFDNTCRRTWNVPGITELEVGDGVLAYYDAEIGEVVFSAI